MRRNADDSGFRTSATQAADLPLLAPQVASSRSKRARDRRRVLEWYLEHTGSAHQCAKALGMLPTTVLPRVTDLRKDFCLTPIPGVSRVPTGLGGTAAPLIITAIGRKELAG